MPDAVVTLSVRWAWDLLLGALAAPQGGEVLTSVVTHPDMARVARSHGLGVVPLDIDLDTLGPDPIQAPFSERTRVLLIAHLFGGGIDLTPLATAARSRGVLVVDDRAHAFAGAVGEVLADGASDPSARERIATLVLPGLVPN